MIGTRFDSVQSMYRAFDRHAKGQISFSDFSYALEQQDVQLDKDTAVQLFNYLDRDSSGYLSYREFVTLCQDA